MALQLPLGQGEAAPRLVDKSGIQDHPVCVGKRGLSAGNAGLCAFSPVVWQLVPEFPPLFKISVAGPTVPIEAFFFKISLLPLEELSSLRSIISCPDDMLKAHCVRLPFQLSKVGLQRRQGVVPS